MLPKKRPNLLFWPRCPSLSPSPNLSDWRSGAPSSSYLLWYRPTSWKIRGNLRARNWFLGGESYSPLAVWSGTELEGDGRGGTRERAMRVERRHLSWRKGRGGILENETEKRDGCVNIYRGRIVGWCIGRRFTRKMNSAEFWVRTRQRFILH